MIGGAFMSKHTFKTKMKTVNFHLTKCYSYKETAALFGINTSDIIQWGSDAKNLIYLQIIS